jgi:hypothetical protein
MAFQKQLTKSLAKNAVIIINLPNNTIVKIHATIIDKGFYTPYFERGSLSPF